MRGTWTLCGVPSLHARTGTPLDIASAGRGRLFESRLAQRFSALVGQGALSYLTAWLMHVAAGLLLDGTGNIRTVASRVGYRSAASIAFKPGSTQRISPYDSC